MCIYWYIYLYMYLFMPMYIYLSVRNDTSESSQGNIYLDFIGPH